jgi:hypothetical protein
MNTSKNLKLATLNVQIDFDLYNELKNLAHERKITLAKLVRDFSEQIVQNKYKAASKQKVIKINTELPIYEINNLPIDDYSPIPTSKNDEISAFRLPNSIRFQR